MDKDLENLIEWGKCHLKNNDERLLVEKIFEGNADDVLKIMLCNEPKLYDKDGIKGGFDNINSWEIAEYLTAVFVIEKKKDMFLQIYHFLDKAEESHLMFRSIHSMDNDIGFYSGIYNNMPIKPPPASWMIAFIEEVIEYRHDIKDEYLIENLLNYIIDKLKDDDLLIEAAMKLYRFIDDDYKATSILRNLMPVFKSSNKLNEINKIANYLIEKFKIDNESFDYQ